MREQRRLIDGPLPGSAEAYAHGLWALRRAIEAIDPHVRLFSDIGSVFEDVAKFFPGTARVETFAKSPYGGKYVELTVGNGPNVIVLYVDPHGGGEPYFATALVEYLLFLSDHEELLSPFTIRAVCGEPDNFAQNLWLKSDAYYDGTLGTSSQFVADAIEAFFAGYYRAIGNDNQFEWSHPLVTPEYAWTTPPPGTARAMLRIEQAITDPKLRLAGIISGHCRGIGEAPYGYVGGDGPEYLFARAVDALPGKFGFVMRPQTPDSAGQRIPGTRNMFTFPRGHLEIARGAKVGDTSWGWAARRCRRIRVAPPLGFIPEYPMFVLPGTSGMSRTDPEVLTRANDLMRVLSDARVRASAAFERHTVVGILPKAGKSMADLYADRPFLTSLDDLFAESNQRDVANDAALRVSFVARNLSVAARGLREVGEDAVAGDIEKGASAVARWLAGLGVQVVQPYAVTRLMVASLHMALQSSVENHIDPRGLTGLRGESYGHRGYRMIEISRENQMLFGL